MLKINITTSLIFLHEFIDHRISNFQAVAGKLTSGSLALAPSPDKASGINSVPITPGKGFEYVLAKPLQQVIGISGRVRLKYPFFRPKITTPVPILRIGDMAEFRLLQDPPVINQGFDVANPVKGILRIGQTEVELGTINLSPRFFGDVRFDWHTSGQARLFQDGRLVGYHNAVAPSLQLDITGVVFGIPNAPLAREPGYRVGRVFVRALLRSDSLALFSKLLPVVEADDDDVGRCRLRTITNLLQLLDRLRKFMTAFHQTTSRPWSQKGGPPQGPFNPEATQAHDLAVTAVAELAKMLRTGDFSAPDRFLEPFTQFLRILRAVQPSQFDALAAEIGAAKIVPEGCRELFEQELEKNRWALAPIIELLAAAAERVRRISERPGDTTGGY